MKYVASSNRYNDMIYRKCGNSGLKLPAISLGLWHNFGDEGNYNESMNMILSSFDMGITHFDLANNYGIPDGSAETNFGKILKSQLGSHRDELIISTKAGYDMWPGPYGEWGSKKYLMASLNQSLKRMGLEYVDIFYSHRHDPNTPLEETMEALETAVRQGKALYVGVSSYSPERTITAADILKEARLKLLIHQPSYSMLNRWVETRLLDCLEEHGIGCIAFSPIAQGLLSNKYLNGIPEKSRAGEENTALSKDMITENTVKKLSALNEIAKARSQSLTQMALAWVLRRNAVTSALVGARNIAQIEENVQSLKNLIFSEEELVKIDKYASESDINLWKQSSDT